MISVFCLKYNALIIIKTKFWNMNVSLEYMDVSLKYMNELKKYMNESEK